MKFKRTLSGLLAIATLALGTASTVGSANAVEVETKDTPQASKAAVETEVSEESQALSYDYGLCDNIEDGVILHAWCWSFETIKNNMKLIAESGYTAVQTSPANLCAGASYGNKLMGNDVDGYDGKLGAWWWQYQPIDFKIGNYQLGMNKQDYVDMCAEADKYGVKIITDIVANHTAKDYTLVQEDLLKAVGIETTAENTTDEDWLNLYHNNWKTAGKMGSDRYTTTYYNLENKSSAGTVWELGLKDINTENPKYQEYLVKYLNELIDAGCDGFRFDTAKHIALPTETSITENGYENTFWTVMNGGNIEGSTEKRRAQTADNKDIFLYGEILDGPYSDYGKIMKFASDDYGSLLRTAVKDNSKNFSTSNIITEKWGFTSYEPYASGQKGIITWVESHDTYCNTHPSASLSDTQIRLAWAVLAARKQGTPLFFNRPDGSSGADKNYWGKNLVGIRGNDQFFAPEVVAVNKFRNAMAGESESFSNIGNNQVLRIDRGNKGVCIINLSSDSVDLSGQTTSLSNGTYYDTASGNKYVVSGGKFTSDSDKVNPRSVATIYNTVDIEVSPSGCTFTNDTLSITPTIKNGSNGTYTVTVDGVESESKDFTSGSAITIGEDVEVGSSSKEITLNLYAKDSSGTIVTKRYTYYKRNSEDITYVYFDNSSKQWSNVYAYIYYNSSDGATIKNAEWPGVLMTDDPGSDYLRYEIPYNLKNGIIIFNNGNGTELSQMNLEGKSKLYNSNGAFAEYTAPVILEENIFPDSDSDFETYDYIYFFNSLGWTGSYSAVMSNDSRTDTLALKESKDLHCYYVKYPVDRNYTSVTFKVGSHLITPAVITDCDAMKPGYVFVPKSETDSGEWISPNNIIEHTIYFGHLTGDFSNSANIYLYRNIGSVTFKNAAEPGASMTPTITADGSENKNLYSYTYYYPHLSEDYNYSDYSNVRFYKNSELIKEGNIKSEEVNFFDLHKDKQLDEPYFFTGASFASSTLTVNINYINHRVANASDSNAQYIEEPMTTTKTVTFTDGDFKKAISEACKDLKMNNTYDEFVFCGSQFEYVKELASLDDNRISGITPYQAAQQNANNEAPYSANFNPHNFAHQNSAFSGVFSDSSNFIKNLNDSSVNDKWITFYSNGNEIDFNKLNPNDLPSDLSVTVYCFCKPKEYNITFHYPTNSDSTIELNNGNLCTTKNHGVIYTCYYNQLIDETGKSNIVPNMAVPSGYRFDGWYTVTFDGDKVQNYLKICSEQEYKYRVTDKMDLYAVFTKENTLFTPGATAYAGEKNGVEKFVDGSTVKYRYNTVLNVYDCDDYGTANDTKITDVAVVYVKASKDNYDLSTTRKNLLSVVKLSETVANRTLINQSVTVKTGTTANCNCYSYKVGDGTNGTFKLTAKNRLQFILTLTKNQMDTPISSNGYSDVLAFTAFKIGDVWTISDNCVYYKNGTGENIMIPNSK